MINSYGDILRLRHPEPRTRQRMSIHDRAAQFSPFAALTGYEAVIREAGRRTHRDTELAEDGAGMLDSALRALEQRMEERPEISVTWFVPDDRKAGGSYRTDTGAVKGLDRRSQCLLMENGSWIPFGRIRELKQAGDF